MIFRSELAIAVVFLFVTRSQADSPVESNNENEPNRYSTSSLTIENQSYEPKESDDNAYNRKSEKSTYNERNADSYGSKSNNEEESLAQPIPEQQSRPLTIGQLYHKPESALYGSNHNNYKSIPNRVQVLYRLNFERDFDQINPRINTSQWVFDRNNASVADNAAFVRHPAQINAKKSSYGKPLLYGKKNLDDAYLEMISIPFARFFGQNGSTGDNYDEAQIDTKTNFTVGSLQRTLFRLKFACKIINAGNNPFPSSLVINPWDDLRLGNCAFRIDDDQSNVFSVALTNEGVWAVYLHNGVNTTDLPFIVKRRIGVRNSYDAIVDAGLEYDGRLNAVNWYLNGYRVWSINMPGVPPPNDGLNKIDLGQGTSRSSYNRTTQFNVRIATSKCLDESDPNNPNSQQRLVALLPVGNSYYGQNNTFYDPNGLRSNVLFGQGVIVKLYKLLVLQTNSIVPTVPQPLPAVYGSINNDENNKYNTASHGHNSYKSEESNRYNALK